MSKTRRRTRAAIARHPMLAVVLVASALAVAFGMSRAANATTGSCTNPATLAGSAFEIDTNANLKVDTTGCIDWLAGGTGSALRTGVITKQDKPSGATDDSFGQGTKEDDPNPTIVDGSIPPQKSDLLRFGVFTETQATAKFLELFWTRINSPQGTTNMDFELNQKFCDPNATPTNCANNSHTPPETPLRTTGDKLITYDLAQGGTVPTISIRTWNGSAWGTATVISGGQNASALGSVNTSLIAAADADAVGNPPNGTLDPFTFGEVAINFNAIFPPGGACGSFGSAYLKSRSSTSFTSELKDFISPQKVTISNCTTITTTLSATAITVGDSVHDSATLTGATSDAGGTVTYTVYTDSACTQNPRDAGTKTVTNKIVPDSNTLQFNSVGTFYWQAVYSGDLNNAGSTSDCMTEVLVVGKKPTTLTTSATASVTIGDPISDTATLSGATGNAGGTITFHLFSDAGCTNEVTTGLTPVTVNGSGNYNSGDFTPTATGTYYWTASYSGDGTNLPSSTSCGDANESSVVGTAPSSIATAQQLFPNDSATVSAGAGGTPTGSVTFKLFAPGDTTCTGPAVYTETVALSSGSASTSNTTTFSVTAGTSGVYRWEVTYPGDASHDPSTSACGIEHFTADIVNS